MRSLLSLLMLLSASFALATPAVRATSYEAAAATARPVPSGNLKSFKDWKAEKVASATTQVEQTRNSIRSLKFNLAGRKTPTLANLEQELSQEQWNLEVATDLSVTDYLVLYLAQQGSPSKLTEAAMKLSPDETAQIFDAYIRSMGAFPSESKGLLPATAYQGR